jgi:uncharacterized membrane protein YkvA (DUF1232 family)
LFLLPRETAQKETAQKKGMRMRNSNEEKRGEKDDCRVTHRIASSLHTPAMINQGASANLSDSQLALVERELECSICLALMRAPCTLVPCGHAVDARCALELWRARHGQAHMLRCAVCRTECFMLLPAYQLRAQCEMIRAHRRAQKEQNRNRQNQADDDDDDDNDDDEDIDVEHLEAEMREYNRFFSQRHDESFFQSLRNNFTLGLRAVRNVPLLPWLHQVLVVGIIILQVAYVVFPFDLLPELQFGMIIGLIDDFIVIALLLIALGLIVRSLWTQQQRQQQRRP